MRRLSGVLLACAMFLIPALSHGHGDLFAQSAPQKTTFTGDVVVMAYAINPDKTADYEKVIATLKDTLSKSEAPEAKQQLAALEAASRHRYRAAAGGSLLLGGLVLMGLGTEPGWPGYVAALLGGVLLLWGYLTT